MSEYERNGMKVVYESDRDTEYPIGVRLYDGVLHFIDVPSAIWLRDYLYEVINDCDTDRMKKIRKANHD